MDELINKTEQESADVKQLREQLEREKENSTYWYGQYSKLQTKHQQHITALQYVLTQMQEGVR